MLAWSPAGIQPSARARSVQAITGTAAHNPTTGASRRSTDAGQGWRSLEFPERDRPALVSAGRRPSFASTAVKDDDRSEDRSKPDSPQLWVGVQTRPARPRGSGRRELRHSDDQRPHEGRGVRDRAALQLLDLEA